MATETVSPGAVDLRAALESASGALYENYRAARALIALLEKMEFSDAMSSTDDYDMVYAVEQLLVQIRDGSETAHRCCLNAAEQGAAA